MPYVIAVCLRKSLHDSTLTSLGSCYPSLYHSIKSAIGPVIVSLDLHRAPPVEQLETRGHVWYPRGIARKACKPGRQRLGRWHVGTLAWEEAIRLESRRQKCRWHLPGLDCNQT
jgi:hypothetical protein